MFENYLNEIESLKKQKRYDEAWELANKALLDLSVKGDEYWFMMYYQMAQILASEGKYYQALERMAFVVHYLGGLGGRMHEKFVLRLLKKVGVEDKFKTYLKVAVETEPNKIHERLKETLV